MGVEELWVGHRHKSAERVVMLLVLPPNTRETRPFSIVAPLCSVKYTCAVQLTPSKDGHSQWEKRGGGPSGSCCKTTATFRSTNRVPTTAYCKRFPSAAAFCAFSFPLSLSSLRVLTTTKPAFRPFFSSFCIILTKTTLTQQAHVISPIQPSKLWNPLQ